MEMLFLQSFTQDLELIIQLLEEEVEGIENLIETNIKGKIHYSLNKVVFSVCIILFPAKILIDYNHLMDIRSDGLCISTPSGQLLIIRKRLDLIS